MSAPFKESSRERSGSLPSRDSQHTLAPAQRPRPHTARPRRSSITGAPNRERPGTRGSRASTDRAFTSRVTYQTSVPGGTQPHPIPLEPDDDVRSAQDERDGAFPWDGEEAFPLQKISSNKSGRRPRTLSRGTASEVLSFRRQPTRTTTEVEPSEEEGETPSNEDVSKPKPSKTSYFSLFKYCEKLDYAILAVGITCAIASGIPLPLIGVLFGQLIDGFNQASCTTSSGPLPPDQRQQFLAGVSQKVVLVIAAACANFVFIYIYTCCWSCFGERLVRKLRQRYIRALLKQDMTYFDQLQPGEVGSRLSADLLTIQTGTNEKCGIFISSLSYFVTSYIIAFIKLPTLAAQLLSLLPAFGGIALVCGKYLASATASASGHLAHANSLATEALANLPSVQAFGASDKLSYIYERHLELARKSGTRRARIAAIQMGLLFFVGYSANALAFYSGSRIISKSSSSDGTIGNVYTVIFLLLDASFIIGQITPYLQTFQSAGGAGQNIIEVIDKPSSIDATDLISGLKPTSSADTNLGFGFRKVTFAYPMRPDVVVAKDLTLDIEAGARIGICGTSGSGKSTVVALCQRLYDPGSGTVLLNGTDLREYNVHWLRSQIGVVGQEPTLFDADVIQSIAHGLTGSPVHEHLKPTLEKLSDGSLYEILDSSQAEDATYKETVGQWHEIMELCSEAAKSANAHEFIEALPDGYRTNLGDAGDRLSGGQKQRLALARAIVKQPRILILDEATAALDSISEQLVQVAIDKVSAGRTTITVAHRLSTLRNCDKIIVMAKGSVIESGSHEELMELKGRYHTLAMAQNAASSPPASTPMSKSNTTVTLVNQGATSPSEEKPFGTDEEPPNKDESEDKSEKRKTRGMFRRLVVMLSPYWPLLLLGFVTSTIIGSSYSAEAVIFGHTIDALSLCGGPERVRSKGELFSLLFFVLALVQLCSYAMNGASFGYVSERFVFTIRKTAFRALLRQHISWFSEEGRSAGNTVSALSSDTASLGGLTGTVIGTIFSVTINLLVGFTLAHIIAWRIAIAIAAAVPLLIASGYMRLYVLAALQRRHETAFSACNALAMEAVSGIKTVAALGREQDIMHLVEYRLQKPYRDGIRQIFVGNLFLAFSLSISYFIYGFAYWWGSRNVAEGRYSQVDFFIVLPALLFSAQASGQLLAFSPDISKAHVAAANVFGLLDECPPQEYSPDEGSKGSPEKMVTGTSHSQDKHELVGQMQEHGQEEAPLALEFRNVWFSYPTRRSHPALQDLSFKVEPGHYVAFAGSSGSGKSTVMSLIERFYEADSGSVLVDNQVDRPAAVVRSNIAWVQQEPAMFYGTIRFNVSLGARPRAVAPGMSKEKEGWVEDPEWERYVSDDDIIEACQAANIHDTIMALPKGYDTLVGAKGSQLSGGQRARLAFARALLRKPRLLLLDESTAALDAESEQIFEQTVEKIRKEGKTTIIAIAHRIRTIQHADKILFFSKGQISAAGTHDELMSINDDYRAMVLHQQLPA
ncbi:hypothetical protein OC846_000025 [Tilletia horrida]|uniref:Leptomycin B resistance protein pmd1 n=1 Tax=Tilletia horrida TaxID=155126 RepID=A0AAN6JXB9_9BASI|nr:hypothetical protein OC846_000025 [Tilletia horrida]